jgi:hypothetical protein
MAKKLTYRNKFNSFWPLFISKHLNPWNRRAHLIGNIWMFCFFVAAGMTLDWKFLAAGFAGYVPSWFGHLYFERNIPNTFQGPILSALCDLKMIGMMFAGELDDEITRLFGNSRPAAGSPVLVTDEQEQKYQAALRHRISKSVPSHPFSQYWDIFLIKHRHVVNVWIHALAIVFLGCGHHLMLSKVTGFPLKCNSYAASQKPLTSIFCQN